MRSIIRPSFSARRLFRIHNCFVLWATKCISVKNLRGIKLWWVYKYIRKVGQTNYTLCFNQSKLWHHYYGLSSKEAQRVSFRVERIRWTLSILFCAVTHLAQRLFYNERFEPLLRERGCKTVSFKFCESERRGQYLNKRSGASVETARKTGDRLIRPRHVFWELRLWHFVPFVIGKKKRACFFGIIWIWMGNPRSLQIMVCHNGHRFIGFFEAPWSSDLGSLILIQIISRGTHPSKDLHQA